MLWVLLILTEKLETSIVEMFTHLLEQNDENKVLIN